MAACDDGLPGVSVAWNWKTALFSGLYRAPGFVAASWRFGAGEAARAGTVEFLLFAALAGFTGALTQRVRHLRPLWVAGLIILVGIPACLHTAEWIVHTALGSAAKGRGVLISLVMTVLAELFNWYVMRQGAMLAGHEGAPFIEDVRRIPSLVGGFFLWVTRARG